MKKINKNLYLGIDIGGSSVKFAVISGGPKNIKTVEKFQVKTPQQTGKLIELIIENIEQLEMKYNMRFLRIGLAVAGVLNISRTKVLNSPNIRNLNGLSLPKLLRSKLGRHFEMNNDANMFVFAESLMGAARGSKNVAGLTLGTGVGSGFLVEGKLLAGAHGGASEIGHTVLVENGLKCSCGGYGHAEEYISARAFRRRGFASQRDLLRAVLSGNKKGKAVFNEFVQHLGSVFANIVNFSDPEFIVVGGGIVESGEKLIKSAEVIAKKNILSPDARRNLKVRKTRLGEYAGAIGAAMVTMRK